MLRLLRERELITEGAYRPAPVNLSRLRFHPESGLIVYDSKAGHDMDLAELTDSRSARAQANLSSFLADLTPMGTMSLRKGDLTVLVEGESREPARVELIVNWFEELKRLVPPPP